MPHKKTVDRKDGPADLVPTLRLLAFELGVSDDTVTQWRRRGLCVGGSGGWSITGTYLAARKAGLKPRLPDDAELVALIEEGMKGVRAEQFDREHPIDGEFVLPGKSAYDPLFRRQPIRLRTEAILREQLIGEEQKNEKLRISIDQEREKLVTKEEATAAAAAVRDGFVNMGKQLWPRVDGKLSEDVASSVREKLATALAAAWAELLAELCL